MESTVLHTTYLSIFAQLGTGAIGLMGLTYDVPSEHSALKASLSIEMGVQLIEIVFYLWFVSHFDLATMASSRYKDWAISTPLMLVSAMIYYYYEQLREEGGDTTNVVHELFQRHWKTIAIVLGANALMLFFGYAGETRVLSMWASVVLGFAAFGVAFYTMWKRFASQSAMGQRLFTLMAIVWSLYGVVYMLPAAGKNIAYNGLDVVAKNFFGIFLALKVAQASSDSTARVGQRDYQLLEHHVDVVHPLIRSVNTAKVTREPR